MTGMSPEEMLVCQAIKESGTKGVGPQQQQQLDVEHLLLLCWA